MKLEDIKVEYTELLDQEELFTKDHVKYRVKVSYKGIHFLVSYQCNKKDKPTKEDVLSCLLSDMTVYDEYNDIDEFQEVFGYEKVSKCLKAFRGCRQNSHKMHTMFTDEELDELDHLVNC